MFVCQILLNIHLLAEIKQFANKFQYKFVILFYCSWKICWNFPLNKTNKTLSGKIRKFNFQYEIKLMKFNVTEKH